MNTSRRQFLKSTAAGALALSLTGRCTHPKPVNVLFIAVDDLRPQLGCYGQTHVISPNIDHLAAEGFLAARSYCNVPVCGASRASLLTGVYPARKRFVNYHTWAEKDCPNHLTLPRHFKNSGYHTVSNGKIFHHRTDCVESWSEDPWRPSGDNWRNYITDENLSMAQESNGKAKPYEIADVPDNAYFDGQIADKTIADMKRLAVLNRPFFIAAGFLKPHLPFNAPKKYWDLYDRDALPMAQNNVPPENAPDAAMHNWGELRSYLEIPPTGPLTDEYAKLLVHGYHACVSYVDAQVGRLLDTLDELGIRQHTVVILWGDHGWNLREHGLWCKHCNFNTSLQAPLIISAPGFKQGERSNGLSEFVDIYPTLCELTGLPVPDHCDGKSLAPQMQNNLASGKKHVFSRFHNGESVRTDRYLYTEWRNNDGNVHARMLYDHEIDPRENINIAELPEQAERVAALHAVLNQHINNRK